MSAKRVFSAGGMVVRKGVEGTKVLVTQHSKHKGWDFPKGHIESGESAEAAALREVEEETGFRAKIIRRVGETQYFYFENGEKVLKKVIFFLMDYISEGVATTAFEVSGKIWLPIDEVFGKLTFKDTKELWAKVKKSLQ